MPDISNFRVVEAYKSLGVTNTRDGLLHIVQHSHNLQTVCFKDVSNLTMIPVDCWGSADRRWCAACRRALPIIEKPGDASETAVELSTPVLRGRFDEEKRAAYQQEILAGFARFVPRRGGSGPNSVIDMEKAKRIVDLICKQGATQTEVAALIGISRFAIYKFVKKVRAAAR